MIHVKKEEEPQTVFTRKRKRDDRWTLTEEQQDAQDHVLQGQNVAVTAVPGAGKTHFLKATAAAAAEQGQKSLLLTYNRKIKEKIRSQVEELHLDDYVQVENFHSAAGELFGEGKSDVATDILLLDLLEHYKVSENKPSPLNFHYILVDEAQDLRPYFVDLIKLIFARCEPRPLIVLVGDERQALYEHMEADSTFLEQPATDDHFGFAGKWHQCTFTGSQRLSPPIAAFLNQQNRDKKYRVIRGLNNGNVLSPKVRIVYLDIWELASRFHELLPDPMPPDGDITILCPSTRTSGKSPLGRFVNDLARTGHNVRVYTDENEGDMKLETNQIQVSSFHQFKGKEAKHVIIVNLDDSYPKYFAPEMIDPITGQLRPDAPLPKAVFVALSRAVESMTIVQSHKAGLFPCFDLGTLAEVADIKYLRQPIPPAREEEEKPPPAPSPPASKAVRDLLRHLPVTTIRKLIKNVEYVEEPRIPEVPHPAPEMVIQGKLGVYASVAHLYGLVVPMIVEFLMTRRVLLVEQVLAETNDGQFPRHAKPTVKRLYDRRLDAAKQLTIIEWMQLANACSIHRSFHASWYQIQNWDWVNVDYIQRGVHQLHRRLKDLARPQFEFPLVQDDVVPGMSVTGRADLDTAKEIWEFKLTTPTDLPGAVLQLAFYCWMREKPGKLLSVMDNRVWNVRIKDRAKFADEVRRVCQLRAAKSATASAAS